MYDLDNLAAMWIITGIVSILLCPKNFNNKNFFSECFDLLLIIGIGPIGLIIFILGILYEEHVRKVNKKL